MRISDWSSDVCSSDLLIEAESYKDSACSGRCTIGVDGDQSIMDVSQPVRVMAGFTFSQERGTLRISGKDGFERRGAADWRFRRNIAEPGVSRHVDAALVRSEERGVGKECVRKGKSRWSP